jgi:hypothetical protein
VRIEGQAGLWKVDRRVLGPMTLGFEVSRLAARSEGAQAASSGRPAVQRDQVHGPTLVRLIDAPLAAPADRPWLFAAAAGVQPGWRRAALAISAGGGAWSELGTTPNAAVFGRSLAAVPPAASTLIDLGNAFEIELVNEAMWLENCTDAALADGANLALIGSELVQFGAAEAIGNRRFRLRRLLRGRRGTEWAAAAHVADEAFTLVLPEVLLPIAMPVSAVGTTARLLAKGIGDGEDGATTQSIVTGETLRPPTPAHLRTWLSENGDLHVEWVRRSRLGWEWTDSGKTPLGEESERYRLTIEGGGSLTIEVTEAAFVYSAAQMAADGVERPVAIRVSQIGTFLSSRDASSTLD